MSNRSQSSPVIVLRLSKLNMMPHGRQGVATDEWQSFKCTGTTKPPPLPCPLITVISWNCLSPSSSAPRQLLQMCLSSLLIWQWIMNGMLLLLFTAGWCGWSFPEPPLLPPRDFILDKQKALRFLGFSCVGACSSKDEAEGVGGWAPEQKHITPPLSTMLHRTTGLLDLSPLYALVETRRIQMLVTSKPQSLNYIMSRFHNKSR